MFMLGSDGWFYEDDEGFMHGPYETREIAQKKYAEKLRKQYAKPCEGDLVES